MVTLLVPAGEPVVVAIDDTLFRRRGKKVWAASWFHDGGAFDRFMRGIGGPGYTAVVTGQFGPGGLDIARAESGFFFSDELAAIQEWVFGPGQAARITQPALVVLGADSAQFTPLMTETVRRLFAMLPHARTQTLPGCSHLMPLQQPAALARLITGLIDSIPAASATDASSP